MQRIEMKTSRRAALLIALLFILAVAVAVGAMFAEAGHHCDGALCPVCAGILRLHALLAQVGALAVALLLLRRLHAPRHAANRARAACPAYPHTLVALRIRMND